MVFAYNPGIFCGCFRSGWLPMPDTACELWRWWGLQCVGTVTESLCWFGADRVGSTPALSHPQHPQTQRMQPLQGGGRSAGGPLLGPGLAPTLQSEETAKINPRPFCCCNRCFFCFSFPLVVLSGQAEVICFVFPLICSQPRGRVSAEA